MDGKQLRNSILQWAIQGKLVPQDPNDEPASVLLDRIREEKARLVKEKKIKRDKNESIIYRGDDNSYYEKFTATGEVKCIDDEITISIPDTWVFVRLQDIFQINPKNDCDDNLEAAFIPMEKIDATYLSSFTYAKKKWGEIKKGFTHFSNGDVAFAKITPCFQNRKSMILKQLPNGIGAGTTELRVLRRYGETIFLEYLLFFLESPYFVDEATFKGTANQQRIISGYLENKLFPLPPLNEQKRIVEMILQLFPVVGRYEKSQESLNFLNSNLKAILKKSILQEAIQGRLVAQCEADEPASALLEKIRAEKERLVKEGKLKKSALEDSVIFKGDDNKYYENLNGEVMDITDQIQFDIPNSWQWVRLSTIFNITMGQSPDGNSVVENGTGMEFHQGKIEFQDIHLGTSRFTTTKPTKIATPNSLLLCVRAPVGVLNITQREICIGRGLCALKPYLDEFSALLWFFLLSTYKMYFEKKATGSTFTAISNEIIKNTLVPLPPVDEQKRILKQILSIFQKLN